MTLHQEIREILKEIWFEDDIDQATDSILKAIKDRVPSEDDILNFCKVGSREEDGTYSFSYRIDKTIAKAILTDLAERMGGNKMTKHNSLHQEIREIVTEWNILHFGNTGFTEHNLNLLTASILKAVKERMPPKKADNYSEGKLKTMILKEWAKEKIDGYNQCLTDLAERIGE